MPTSHFDGIEEGRHRRPRDRGFGRVEIAAVVAGVSVLAVAGAGAVFFGARGEDGGKTIGVESVAQDAKSSETAAETDPAAAGAAEAEEAVVAPRKKSSTAAKSAETAKATNVACSAKRSNVTLDVDSLVHELGSTKPVRNSAAESVVVARPAGSNPCAKVPLPMGTKYLFEGKLPYGKWVLDISLNDARRQVPITVAGSKFAAPKQTLNGDCGGTRKIDVKVVESSVLGGLTNLVTGDAPDVTAKRVVDRECSVPAQSTVTTGPDGTFAGTIGYGDWMFSVDTASGKKSEFVTVRSSTAEVVIDVF